MRKFEISNRLPDRRQEFHEFIQELKLVCVVNTQLNVYLSHFPVLGTIDNTHELALRSFLFYRGESYRSGPKPRVIAR